jgi:hypothetical protein
MRSQVGATAPPPLYIRAIVAVVIGVSVGIWCHDYLARNPQFFAADFTFPWRAAGHLLAGRDPYQHMPRVRAYAASGPFPYPLTSALIAAPLAGLGPPAAGGVFIGVSFTVLGFALTKRGYWPLLTLLSAPVVLTLTNVQWAPLLLAAVLLPGLGWLGAAKPNLGVVAFVLRPQWSTLTVGGLLLAIAFFLIPAWPLEWLQHVRMATLTYRPVATWPLGAVGLLGLLRWRTFEGRVLAAMTLMPLAPFHYDHLFLWLVPRTWRQSLALSACSWVSVIAVLATTPHDLTRDPRAVQTMIVAGMYLPAALLVLRAPNVGHAAAWVERMVRDWPAWLRGDSAMDSFVGPSGETSAPAVPAQG